jgi:histidinol phosphatase-like enzyme
VKQKHDGISSKDDGSVNTENECVRKFEEPDFIPSSIDAIREVSASRARVFVTADRLGFGRGFLADYDFSAGYKHLVDIQGKLHVSVDASHLYALHQEFGRPSLESRLPLTETDVDNFVNNDSELLHQIKGTLNYQESVAF